MYTYIIHSHSILYAYVLGYIVAIIIFNKLLSLRSIKDKKSKKFYFTIIFPSLMFFLSLCRSDFLTCVISLLPETLLSTFLNGRFTGNKCLQFVLAWGCFYFSFTFEKHFHVVQNSRLVVSFPQHFTYFTLVPWFLTQSWVNFLFSLPHRCFSHWLCSRCFSFISDFLNFEQDMSRSREEGVTL